MRARLPRPYWLLLCAFVLGGCQGYNIVKVQPGASADELRRTAGKPTATWRNATGEVLEYSTGARGYETHLAQLDASGRVKNVRQVRQDEYFEQVKPGMTKEQVRELLGTPGGGGRYPVAKEEVWSWRYLDHLQKMFFNVHFDLDGSRVKTTSRSIDRSDTVVRAPFPL